LNFSDELMQILDICIHHTSPLDVMCYLDFISEFFNVLIEDYQHIK